MSSLILAACAGVAPLICGQMGAQVVVISEFTASNSSTLTDSLGETSDFRLFSVILKVFDVKFKVRRASLRYGVCIEWQAAALLCAKRAVACADRPLGEQGGGG